MINALKKVLLASAMLFLALGCDTGQKPAESATPTTVYVDQCLTGLSAGVACAHPEAARVGAEILAMGGNAVDASIAMQWALAVCYPVAGNLGGGGFMVARMANGEAATLDFRETAPAMAHPNFYLDEEGAVTAGKSIETHFAAGVPGTVHGLFSAHEKLGRMDMATLIRPAIEMALTGFPLTKIQAERFNDYRSNFADRNDHPVAFVRPEGQLWQEGDTLTQPELAATLTRILQEGTAGFYKGETAKLIEEEMAAAGGWITTEDLADYASIWREPVRCTFDSITLIGMGPPSSGGIALCQLVQMYTGMRGDTLAHNTAAYIHALVEMQRRVYADRASYLGDPEFATVPLHGLLDDAYLAGRMADFDPTQATPSGSIRAGTPTFESPETTHLSVIDAEGNAVSVTTTINGAFGSKIAVRGAGFLLNNEMDDFSLKPGEPNMFGLIGGKANEVQAGKRMLSSMTPTIVEKHGQLYLVAGSPGGSTIITSVLQTVLNTCYHSMSLEEAIAVGKFHSQWLPDVVTVEAGRIDSAVLHTLRGMGHHIENRPSLGRVDALLVTADGTLDACGDHRSDNAAGGIKP